jgi:hypothetical protein
VRRAALRTLAQLSVIFVGVVALSFGLQALVLRRPTRQQLIAARALHKLLAYQVVRATERIGDRTLQSVCLDERLTDAKTHRPEPAAFVLMSPLERLYDLDHGVRALGRRPSRARAAQTRFLLAGCPYFLASRLGAGLSRQKRVSIEPVRADGVPALRVEFSRNRHRLVLYVARGSLRPLELAVVGRAEESDLEPQLSSAQVEPVMQAAFGRRFRLG